MAAAPVGPPEPDAALARRLFDELDRHTRQGAGITRASYGDGEQFAHDLIAKTAREIGLQVSTDVAGNLYATLEGRKPGSGTLLIASHLDSVPQGGNFDGAAGVVAGMAILASWKKAGFAPEFDVATMAIFARRRAPGFRIPISDRKVRLAFCRRKPSTCGAPIRAARSRNT